jgi:dienelactone hydrolase
MYSVSQSLLTFESGGKAIQMDCFAPAGNGRRFPAVIGLHGSGGGYPVVFGPARLLAAHGFVAYSLHYFERTGTEVASGRGTVLLHAPAWMKTIRGAISFVSTQPEVDAERIGLLGISLGAYLSLAVASIDDRVTVVIDYFGGFPKEMKLFMRRFCPVLVLHGEADDVVPVAEAGEIRKIAERKNVPCEVKIYPGVGHGFPPEIMQDAGQRALDFLKRHLARDNGTSGPSAAYT